MRSFIRSPFPAAVIGGVVVAAAFLLLGLTGGTSTRTVLQEAPVAAVPASNTAGLTAHQIYARYAPSVVFVRAQVTKKVTGPFAAPGPPPAVSTGSGFLVDHGGDILTNFHVVSGADRNQGVTVRFADDIKRRAAVVEVDPNNDLALLHVSMSGLSSLQPLALGDSTYVEVGDPILAIGNPFGLDRTLTTGIVSALQGQIQTASGFKIDNVIQTDAPADPASSGGPLLDAAGQVIGITSTVDGGAGAGIPFAVPINTAKALLYRWSAVTHGGSGGSVTPPVGGQPPSTTVQAASPPASAPSAGSGGGGAALAKGPPAVHPASHRSASRSSGKGKSQKHTGSGGSKPASPHGQPSGSRRSK